MKRKVLISSGLLIAISLWSVAYAAAVPTSLTIIDVIGNTSSLPIEKGVAVDYLIPKNYKIAHINLTIGQVLRNLFTSSNVKNLPLYGYLFSSNHAFAKEK